MTVAPTCFSDAEAGSEHRIEATVWVKVIRSGGSVL